jgi:hypothetical protein
MISQDAEPTEENAGVHGRARFAGLLGKSSSCDDNLPVGAKKTSEVVQVEVDEL